MHNFADDNTITAVAETIQGLINGLEVKTSNAIKWMKDNDMTANPDKFKAIMLTRTDHNTAGIRLQFSGETILSSNEIDLLGITIDTKLSFDSHIAKICRKASRQLNALKRLGFYIPLDTRKLLANPLSSLILTIVHLSGIFQRQNSFRKSRKYRKGFSDFCTMIMCQII